MLSMTGFARKSAALAWGTMTFEISSVNHRYQELSVRLPREFSALEPALTARLRAALGRGKIRANVEIVRNPEFKTAVIDKKLLANYWTQLSEVAQNLDGSQTISITSLLSLPGVSELPRDGELENEIEGAIFSLADEAVLSFTEMKRNEGASLARDIEAQLDDFSRIIEHVAHEWQDAIPEALAAARARLEKFLSEISGVSADPARIAQEIAMLSDKWDISEEIVRSRSHLEKFREMIIEENDQKSGTGRKLDFMTQEMNREINTMGSKMQNAPLRWQVVEAKACLERVREQIQNVD